MDDSFEGLVHGNLAPLLLGLGQGRVVEEAALLMVVVKQREKQKGARIPKSLSRYASSDLTSCHQAHFIKVPPSFSNATG